MGDPRGLGEEIPDLPRPQYEALIPFISDPLSGSTNTIFSAWDCASSCESRARNTPYKVR